MTVEYMDDCAVHEPSPAAFATYARGYARGDFVSYVMTSPFPGWLGSAKNRLEELGTLPPDWNSYGAKPVSALARTAAYGLLRQLAGPNTPKPALVPTSDGSVQIEWHTRGIDLEIRVLSSTRISICFEDLYGDVAPMEDELQYDLTALGEAIQVLSNR